MFQYLIQKNAEMEEKYKDSEVPKPDYWWASTFSHHVSCFCLLPWFWILAQLYLYYTYQKLSKRDRCGNTTAWFCLCLQGRLHRQAFPDGVLAGSDHQAARPHRLHQDDRRRLGAGRVSARCRGRLGLPETGPVKTLQVRVWSTLWFGSRSTSFHPRETTGATILWELIGCATNAWVRPISVYDDTSAISVI